MVESGRRDPRYRCTQAMTLKSGRAQAAVETEDVSFSGVFVATGSMDLQVRQLVQLETQLEEGRFEAHAMVVFVRRAGERPAGAGLKFFGLSRDTLERWARFVRVTRDRELANPAARAPVQRSSNAAVVIKVRPPGLDALVEVYTRDIAEGGMFVETDQPLLVGSRLMAEIVHPDTGEAFELGCVVRRVVKAPKAGVGVEFVGLDDSLRTALHEFVSSVVPPIVIEGFED